MDRRSKRKIGLGLLVSGLMSIGGGIALEGTALADPTFDASAYPLHLHSSHHNSTYADKFISNCGDYTPPDANRLYLWHFLVPSYPGGQNGGTPDVTGVLADFVVAGQLSDGHVVQSGKGWNLYTDTADTLIDAVGFNDTWTSSSSQSGHTPVVMNLSHTCGPNSSSSSSSSRSSSSSESSSSESSSSVSSSSESSSSVSSSSESSSSMTSSSVSSSSESSSSRSRSSRSSSSPPPVIVCCVITSSSSSASSSSDLAVLGDPVTRDVPPDPPAAPNEPSAAPAPVAADPAVATPAPEVKDVQVTRQLPQTGVDPGLLLMIGGLMFISGVLLLRYSDDPTDA